MGERTPDIKSLVRREDVDGLRKAATYRDPMPGSEEPSSDSGIQARAQAVLALGSVAPEEGLEAITAALRDPADHVRCAAVRVLHALHEGGALAQALRWLPTDEGNSRLLALQAINDLPKSISASAMASALIYRENDELLDEPDVQLILAVREEHEAGETDEAVEVLVEALADDRGIVVDRAAELLVRLGSQSTEALVAELRRGSAPANAAYVLGRIVDPETLDPLVKALKHRDARVRAESAAALAELEDPAAVKPLLRATRDKDHKVRSQARTALDRMGTTAVIEGVAALLQPTVRQAVRSAIGKADAEDDGRTDQARPPARRSSRPRQANGGPSDPSDPRPAETPPALDSGRQGRSGIAAADEPRPSLAGRPPGVDET